MKRKKVQKRKRRLTMFGFALTLLVVSLMASIVSGLFLRNYNNSLVMKIEDTKRETALLNEENEQLSIDIQTLSSKDRVYEIASAAGLEKQENNVQNVVKGE